MKVLLVPILTILLLNTALAQQLKWRSLPDAPFEPTSRFEDCFFINDSTGWIIHIDGRVYKTSNGGEIWDLIYSRNPNDVTFRCINFISEQTGFIGDIQRESNADGAVLYKTTDGGSSWSVVTLPDPVPNGLCGLYSLSEYFIYGVGRYYGSPVFIKSEDGGLNWQSISLDTLARALVDVYFISPDTGFAAGSVNQSGVRGAVFKTNDGGNTWEVAAISSLTGISS
ncbi:MAG: YCF48-related protein, partial [Ignavibacteriaceae bacterium]